MQTRSAIAFSVLMGMACNAQAAIVYLSDDRYIDHTMNGAGPITPSPAYSDFNVNWWAWEAGAFQNTTLTSGTMSGNGSTYAGYDAQSYGAEATSVFSVTFSVDQLTDFSLTGFLDTNWYFGSQLYMNLSENGTSMYGYTDSDALNLGINPFSFDGQFAQGNIYQLYLYSFSSESDYYYETWDFDLTTSPAVPVPAAAWLFVSGLAGLIGVAKRRAG
ncbi:MAG: VPLPA-CTERM sorting domain-containing protein [Gammaproteobacteria bacterium]|nr:VPLPA-CTERM sorting domain-containing protein [Gammaproteobacteria bacterium]